MKENTDNLVDGLARASKVLGRKDGTSVVFQGDKAEVRPNGEIVLPALPTNVDIGEQEAAAIRGYADSKAGMIRHTNKSKFFDRMERYKEHNKSHSGMLDILETVRVNREVQDEYSGSKKNIAALQEKVNEQIIPNLEGVEKIDGPENIPEIANLLDQKRRGMVANCDEILNKVDDTLIQHGERYLDALDRCKSTQDTLNLMDILEKELQQNSFDADPEPIPSDQFVSGEEGDGDEVKGDPQQGEGEGEPQEGEGEGEPDDGEGEGEGEGEEGGNDDGEGEEVEDDKDREYNPNVDPILSSGEKAAGDVIERIAKETLSGDKELRIVPWTTKYDTWVTKDNYKTVWCNNSYASRFFTNAHTYGPKYYNNSKQQAQASVNVIRSKLTRYLKAKEQRNWDSGREFGRLDTRRLVRAYQGNPYVFRLPEDRDEINTAISILVDCSGSMCGQPMSEAQKCTIALAEALEPTAFKYAVSGFTSFAHPESSKGYRARKEEFIAWRTEANIMLRFKDWDDRLFDSKDTIGYISDGAMSNNNDPEAIRMATSDLLKRQEKKKVLIVLSDGSPAFHLVSNESSYEAMHRDTKAAVMAAEEAGIKTIGIGLEDTSVKKFYPQWFVLNDVSQLASTVLDVVLKQIG